MKFITASCPNCGANFQSDENDKQYICQFCGTQIMLQPVDTGKPALNDEYENKMAAAKSMEDIYFRVGTTTVTHSGAYGYDAMNKYYGDAERAGGVTRGDYWLSLARFRFNAAIKSVKDQSMTFSNREAYINMYAVFMDNAVKYSSPEDKAPIEQEKNQNIQILREELKKVNEIKAGCYIATAVYHSYDCPQVWVLRRFRDQYLEKSLRGRMLIKIYYAISPKIVKIFGTKRFFSKILKPFLDKLVSSLQLKGVKETPYNDNCAAYKKR